MFNQKATEVERNILFKMSEVLTLSQNLEEVNSFLQSNDIPEIIMEHVINLPEIIQDEIVFVQKEIEFNERLLAVLRKGSGAKVNLYLLINESYLAETYSCNISEIMFIIQDSNGKRIKEVNFAEITDIEILEDEVKH